MFLEDSLAASKRQQVLATGDGLVWVQTVEHGGTDQEKCFLEALDWKTKKVVALEEIPCHDDVLDNHWSVFGCCTPARCEGWH